MTSRSQLGLRGANSLLRCVKTKKKKHNFWLAGEAAETGPRTVHIVRSVNIRLGSAFLFISRRGFWFDFVWNLRAQTRTFAACGVAAVRQTDSRQLAKYPESPEPHQPETVRDG